MREPKFKSEAHASETTPRNWTGMKRVAQVPLRRDAEALRQGRYEGFRWWRRKQPLPAKRHVVSLQGNRYEI
jgi:hypothetical protein